MIRLVIRWVLLAGKWCVSYTLSGTIGLAKRAAHLTWQQERERERERERREERERDTQRERETHRERERDNRERERERERREERRERDRERDRRRERERERERERDCTGWQQIKDNIKGNYWFVNSAGSNWKLSAWFSVLHVNYSLSVHLLPVIGFDHNQSLEHYGI